MSSTSQSSSSDSPSPDRSYSKWNSRFKCNLYYYRTNYFILIMFLLAMGFLSKPLAVVVAFLTGPKYGILK
ncbi:hypothetical protein C4D60_Mb10t24690 [Musa balbisiana]|uniref:PRA1 family protein n=1 Tax=Musa balbisiana TaxID=52838 RepID=A0A4S8IZM0_MUSBA|nr:hypothetical protein C4D60_Mb10t24690 [Musa balbisiana]